MNTTGLEKKMETLAPQQAEAALVGGAVWQEFVRSAEVQTGFPWSRLRELLDPYMVRFYETHKRNEKGPAAR